VVVVHFNGGKDVRVIIYRNEPEEREEPRR
jgi:hypothetical protein